MKLINRHYSVCCFLLIASTCLAQDGAEYRPEWRDGQRWCVEVDRMTQRPEKPDSELVGFEPRIMKIIYEFEVDGTNSIDGELCTSIRLRVVRIDGANALSRRYFQLQLRQSDLTLKKLQSLDSKTGDVVVSRSFEVGAIDATDRVGFLPLVFPIFDADVLGKDSANPGGHVKKIDENRCCQSKAMKRARSADGAEEAVLEFSFEHNGYNGTSRHARQLWMKGLPWWSEAILEVDGKLECVARLTSMDGVDLPKTTPQVWAPKIVGNKLGVETNMTLTVVEEAPANAVPAASNFVESATESE